MTDNEIIKALECCSGDGDCGECPYREKGCELEEDALDLIKRQKEEITKLSADVEPVKHGHWYNRGGRFHCSVCDTKAYLKDVGGTGGWSHEYIQQKSQYCPNCGAKMDGE